MFASDNYFLLEKRFDAKPGFYKIWYGIPRHEKYRNYVIEKISRGLMKLKIFILTLFFLLSSCATTQAIQPQQVNDVKSDEVIIKNFLFQTKIFHWQLATVKSISNNEKYNLKNNLSLNYSVTATPGNHLLKIYSEFLNGILNPYEANLQLNVDLKTGSKYYLKADIVSNKIRVWLEDSSGNRVSKIASAVYSPVPPTEILIVN